MAQSGGVKTFILPNGQWLFRRQPGLAASAPVRRIPVVRSKLSGCLCRTCTGCWCGESRLDAGAGKGVTEDAEHHAGAGSRRS
jgi:hypothetical protein